MQLLHLNTIQIFVQWQEELESMDYTNKVYKGLNALDFWCSTITIKNLYVID